MRRLFINDPFCNQTLVAKGKRQHQFPTNRITNAKYSLLTFIPLFVKEQFSNYANIFFLLIGVLQQFPSISPTNRFTTIIPFALVLLLFASKEFYEELERRRADSAINNAPVTVVDGSRSLVKASCKLQVGEIVMVSRNEQVPADMVIISCSDRHLGRCYVETVTLDGESNLKEKQCIEATNRFDRPVNITQFLRGTVECDEPNNDLYQFSGTISLKYFGDYPLEPKNLLLRGSVLKKVEWVYGICVYTGRDCKIIRNATLPRLKQTLVATKTNQLFIFIFFLIAMMALFSAVMNLWINYNSHFYRTILFQPASPSMFTTKMLKNSLTFLILYNNLIPVSLIVTCELIKIQHAKFIACDLDLYDSTTEIASQVHCSNVVEDLGQISYIFSDKTGTLTQNQMQWKEFVIDTRAYSSLTIMTCSVREELFVHTLMLCNSALPVAGGRKKRMPTYETSSSDDWAIMNGCSELGFVLLERTPTLAVIKNPNGMVTKYQIIRNEPFCFKRKRVSVLVRREDCHDCLLLTKGSDTSIDQFCIESEIKAFVLGSVKDWSCQGLRTMVLSYKMMEGAVLQTNVNMDILETGSTMLGAIAIEDKLAVNLRETIDTLSSAGIKIFVVTGDKLETTLAIATSCNLISLNNPVHQITLEKSIVEQLDNVQAGRLAHMVITFDGEIFDFIEKNSLLVRKFIAVLVRVKSAIFYRFSPLQKAKLVSLVKTSSRRAVLAIGDGANDVGMIQMASVGVGIHGREGFQAARASDISIGKFYMLSKLVLVHGSWCYYRLTKTIIYSLYKNTVFYMAQFLFAFFNQFSGQTLFESWMIGLYNVLFTLIPPFTIGFWEKSVTLQALLANPSLYRTGLSNEFFNWKRCLLCLFNSIFHSVIIIGFLFLFAWQGLSIDKGGRVDSLWLVGCIGFSCIIVTVTLKAALITINWTKWVFILFGTSIVFYFPFLVAYILICPWLGIATEFKGLLVPLFACRLLWVSLLLMPSCCLLVDYCWKYYQRMYQPSPVHLAQNSERKQRTLLLN